MKPSTRRQILVTSALPYANGPLHLGHIIEAVQTDVWVRFQRMRGHDCLYVCAEDTHGTPIMIKAQSEGITPEQLIERVAREHGADYRDFLIGHDHFHSTHTAENRFFTDLMYTRRVHHAPGRAAGLRRNRRHVPARPLCARHLSQVRRL